MGSTSSDDSPVTTGLPSTPANATERTNGAESVQLPVEVATHLLYFSTQEARVKLMALQVGIDLTVQKLVRRPHPDISVSDIHVLIEIGRLLADMEERAANPLVEYASRAGRKGPTKRSNWETDGRRFLCAAAYCQSKLNALRAETPAQKKRAFTEACQQTWKAADGRIKASLGHSLGERLGGEWSRRTPERARQQKKLATGGERLQGWGEKFKAKNDYGYSWLLKGVDDCQSPEELERKVQGLFEVGIQKLLSGIANEPKQEPRRE